EPAGGGAAVWAAAAAGAAAPSRAAAAVPRARFFPHASRSRPRRRATAPLLVRGYPTPRSGPANPRRDNQRPRRWDPKPNTSGPPAPHRVPTRREYHSAPNAGEPARRSVGAGDRVLGARRGPNHWVPDASLGHYRSVLAR